MSDIGSKDLFTTAMTTLIEHMSLMMMEGIDEKHKLEKEHFEATDNLRWELEKAQEAESYFRNQAEAKDKEIAELREKLAEANKSSEMYRKWWLSETEATGELKEKLKALEDKSNEREADSEEEKATA